MNKTIIININSIVFHIEEDAYEILKSYMSEIKGHFGQTVDSVEILQDIENRIAEMFSERIHAGKKEVITSTDVRDIITQMGRVSDFEDYSDSTYENTKDHASEPKEEKQSFTLGKKLMRDPEDKLIGGVCSGLGYYFGIQTVWVRIFFVLVFLFMGSGILLYVVLWVIMPMAETRTDRMSMRGEIPNLQNLKKNFEGELGNYKAEFSKVKGYFSEGAKGIGNGAVSVLRLLGNVISFMMLIFLGSIIIGLIVAFTFGLFGVFSNNVNIFPPLTPLSPLSTYDAFFALLAGFVALLIPFVTLFYVFLRILFKASALNNYVSLGLWAAWVISVIAIIYFGFKINNALRTASTLKVDKQLDKQEVYFFAERDLNVIDASQADGKKRIFNTNQNLEGLLLHRIDVDFETLDSLEQPFVQYNFRAKGATRQQAAENAAEIEYELKQDAGKIFFDSHFMLKETAPKRDQSILVKVFLPIGSKVMIDKSLRNKLNNVSYNNCVHEDEEGVKETEWIMRKSGLACANPVKKN